MPRLRLPRSAFGLNGHGGRYCRAPCARLCPYSFPGGRHGSSSGRGRHVVRRRRGCLKDGLAEAPAAAAGGSGSWGSGSLEPSPLGVRLVPRRGQCPWILPVLRRGWGPVRRQRLLLRGDTKVVPQCSNFRTTFAFSSPTWAVLSPFSSAPRPPSQSRPKSLTHTGVPTLTNQLLPTPPPLVFCPLFALLGSHFEGSL